MKLRLPPVIGYLLSGVVLGPHVLGSLRQSDAVSTIAEIGIVLLMFTLGLEFDARYFLRIRRVALGSGLAQILLTILAALLAGRLFGWSIRTSLFLGCIVALSSTAIVLKSLMRQGVARHSARPPDRGDPDRPGSRHRADDDPPGRYAAGSPAEIGPSTWRRQPVAPPCCWC